MPTINQQGQSVQNQVNIGTMHGDIYYRRIELEALLREVFDPLIEERRALFGGREAAFRSIGDFVRRPEGGYLVITAYAGFGKTSLIAELVGTTPDAFAYHFFTSLYGERSLSEAFFLRNMVQQMALWHGETKDVPVDVDKLTALYHQYLDRSLAETRIIVLDGLDEVGRWSLRPYLQRRLPQRLHVIVTVRDVGQDWRADYGFPADQVTHLPLGGLTSEDIAAVLAAAEAAAPVDAEAVQEVARVAAYDEARPELGADPLYVGFLAKDLALGKTTAAELTEAPSGLDVYLDGWWREIRAQAGDEATQDLFGTLTAARGRLTRADLEAVNPSLAGGWAGDFFDDVLAKARRYVTGDDEHGYALAHPRLQAYLRDPRRIRAVPAYTQKLLAYCDAWAANHSRYALQHGIDHLAAEKRFDELYARVLDADFRETQQAVLDDTQPTLDDLRLALDIAVEADWPARIVACVAAYRDTRRNRPLTRQLFGAVDTDGVEAALTLAKRYLPAPDWPRLLHLYLAFEAAAAGERQLSLEAARAGLRLPVKRMAALSEAFVVATARLLAQQTGQAVEIVVGELLPDQKAATVVAAHPQAEAVAPAELRDLIDAFEPQLTHFEELAAAGDSEAVISVMPLLEQESRSDWFYADDMRVLLPKLAGSVEGWSLIERTLRTILPNPYQEYRDIGLEVIGKAILAADVANPSAQLWMRQQWQQILLATLDQEGVTFTFDVPFLLLGLAETRGAAADAALQKYCEKALPIFDKWGTRMRAHSARAMEAYRQGNAAEADGILVWLVEETHGYAGFATQNLIAIANRWLEMGRTERLDEPLSEWSSLTWADKLEAQAGYVRDNAFRAELQGLVQSYHEWRSAEEVPAVEAGLAPLRRLEAESARSLYFDYLSARWSAAQDGRGLAGLKALLPLVLDDGTLVDLVLARLLRQYLSADEQALSDGELPDVQATVAASLTTGRPWELVHGPQIG